MRIFLCHAHEDKDAVLKLYRRLRDDGFQPWMDKEDLVPGQDWQVAIRKAVRESEIFLACISHHSVRKAGFVNREINFALDVAEEQPEGTIFIIPVRLEDMEDSTVPDRLSRWHCCDYFEKDGHERLLRALHMRAEQIGDPLDVEQSPTPPQFTWAVATVVVVLVVLLAVPPTNPLFPVTAEEWNNEMARRTTEMTREGDHYWRYVPGGTYTIGGWTDDDNDNNDEQAEVELQPYWIGKYPITVAQYRQFIEAGGYDKQEYWTPNGWEWKEAYNEGEGRSQPFRWNDERYSSDNQPVIGITWYEATAFMNWLNAQIAGSLPEGYAVQLPTDAEWEAACAYDAEGHRYPYPWGEEEPTRNLADFDDGSEPDRAADVGRRTGGAAACGAQDMVGSVWEVTTSSFRGYPGASGKVVGDFKTVQGDV